MLAAWLAGSGLAQAPAPQGALPREFDPSQSLAERRSLAQRWAAEAPAEAEAKLEALLADPDPEVRLAWLHWATRPDLDRSGEARRAERAIRALAQESSPDAARPWLEALARWTVRPVLDWLPGQWLRGDVAQATVLAQSVRPGPSHGPLVAGVLDAWANRPQEPGPPPEVLAELLPHLGPWLGDLPRGDLVGADFQPLVVGLHHPSPEVQAGARTGLAAFLDRLIERDDPDRIIEAIGAMQHSGLEAEWVGFESIRLAFFPLADGNRALEQLPLLAAKARSVLLPDAPEAWSSGRFAFRAHYLGGMAHLSLLQAAEASEAFRLGLDRNRLELDRYAWIEPSPVAQTVPRIEREHLGELLQERILLLIGANLADHLAQPDGALETCLARFLEAHRLHLEAQAHFTMATGQSLGGWDALFDHSLSPYRLLLHGRRFAGGLTLEQELEWELWLARGLATVSPLEMPGFEPLPCSDEPLKNPMADVERRTLLGQIQRARVEFLAGQIDALQRRVSEAQSSPVFQVPEKEIEELALFDRQRRILVQAIESGDLRTQPKALLELRVAGGHALRLARNYRTAGMRAEGRELVRRFQADLNQGGIGSSWYFLGQERLARADLELGSNLSDDDRPLESEKVLLLAVERLQGLVDRLKEVGAPEATAEPYRDLLASALVSVAVNANVRLGQPDRALEFYERAYLLKQDEFMRVLLACYRARSGKRLEALDLLASVNPSPPLYYNLACTHALLGNTQEALRWLRLEFTENQREVAGRERQKDWARKDPDLISLRDLPQFQQALEAGD
ncbi:MAG: hypothetical protein H6829_12720 [Planctomycetes bacterium]|nr:hypothetical protein [Planctomycetota bacterium]MCB9912150.1 hypothetical protein [Planctomycetota bacterium]